MNIQPKYNKCNKGHILILDENNIWDCQLCKDNMNKLRNKVEK